MKNLVHLLFGLLILALPIGLVSAYISINPIDIDKYFNEYEKVTIKEPVFKEECIAQKIELNGTLHKAYCYVVVDYYNDKIITTEKIIGISDGKETIKNAYKKDNIVSIWTIPIGDRNFEEYGKCRKYEKDKGVCYEK